MSFSYFKVVKELLKGAIFKQLTVMPSVRASSAPLRGMRYQFRFPIDNC